MISKSQRPLTGRATPSELMIDQNDSIILAFPAFATKSYCLCITKVILVKSSALTIEDVKDTRTQKSQDEPRMTCTFFNLFCYQAQGILYFSFILENE